jgi:hypothetical protein
LPELASEELSAILLVNEAGTRSGETFLIVRMIMIRALEAKGSRHAI